MVSPFEKNLHETCPFVSILIFKIPVDEDWPLEVYDRFGDAINVTMRPFDMVFYESHSLVHGRPFPLVGRYFANIFIHFEATGEHLDGSMDSFDADSMLPPYILPNSPWAEEYLKENPTGWSKVLSEKDYDWLLELANEGDLNTLQEYLDLDPRLVNVQNDDGWQVSAKCLAFGLVQVLPLSQRNLSSAIP